MTLEKIIKKSIVGATLVTTGFLAGCAPTVEHGGVYLSNTNANSPVTASNVERGVVLTGKYQGKVNKDGTIEFSGESNFNPAAGGSTGGSGIAGGVEDCAKHLHVKDGYTYGVEFVFANDAAKDLYVNDFVELFKRTEYPSGNVPCDADMAKNMQTWRKFLEVDSANDTYFHPGGVTHDKQNPDRVVIDAQTISRLIDHYRGNGKCTQPAAPAPAAPLPEDGEPAPEAPPVQNQGQAAGGYYQGNSTSGFGGFHAQRTGRLIWPCYNGPGGSVLGNSAGVGAAYQRAYGQRRKDDQYRRR